jgi:hypothetical protein
VVAKLKADFEASPFWAALRAELLNIDGRYRTRDNYALLMDGPVLPEVVTKPYKSAIEKAFRKNVVHNPEWPRCPSEGWCSPDNWFARIPDLVRTTFTVKYLDGVEYLAAALVDLAKEHGLDAQLDYEARPEGYYAAHLVVGMSVAVPRRDWDTETVRGRYEIQITTQLQEVIRKLLHRYYESSRVADAPPLNGPPWQWDYKGEQFVANYLGHILHYVEGMIMEVRERQRD